jgi:GNAT superfamily N-acetyltransferase
MTTPASRPRADRHIVEPAGPGDADVLAQVIADAFADLDVSRWLVPDPSMRRAVFPGYFALLLRHALDQGLVLTTPERDAAALWLPVPAGGPGEPPAGHHERLAALTGQHLARFEALDHALDRHYPDGPPHEHLAILAVRPTQQRLGIGSALLTARHGILDRNGTPAYLEASDPAKAAIYRTHGYTDLPTPIQLPGGPAMYPMWRQPRGGARPGGKRT